MPGSRLNVHLQRHSPDVPWGFRVQGGRDLNQAITVQRVSRFYAYLPLFTLLSCAPLPFIGTSIPGIEPGVEWDKLQELEGHTFWRKTSVCISKCVCLCVPRYTYSYFPPHFQAKLLALGGIFFFSRTPLIGVILTTKVGSSTFSFRCRCTLYLSFRICYFVVIHTVLKIIILR